MAQAARMLGLDRRTIRRMCDAGSLQFFTTSGGHRRFALAELEAFRSRGDTDTNTKIGRSLVSSPTAQYRKESVEELKALIEQKKMRLALEELEDREREIAEQKEAARQAQENEARREQREREAERTRRDAEREREAAAARAAEEHRKWESSWLRVALDCLAADVPGAARIEVADAVRQELDSLYDLREHAELVKEKLNLVIENVLQPYRRSHYAARAVSEAVSQARIFSFGCGWEQQPTIDCRAREQASAAIAALSEAATPADILAVGRSTGQRVGQGFQEQQLRERAQHKREREIDGYLGDVLPYLMELERAPELRDIEFASGEILDLAPKIKTSIKPKLLQDSSLNCLNAKQRVRQLVDDWLENSLKERDRIAE